MADPITAHGWTATTDDDGAVLQHWGGNVTGLGHAARADLARCIEDAAALAKVRDVLTRWDADDTATLDHLLALLSEDGTPLDACQDPT